VAKLARIIGETIGGNATKVEMADQVTARETGTTPLTIALEAAHQ
jgi:hypothetical protein